MANEQQPSFDQKIEAIRETLELVASMHLESERRHEEFQKQQDEFRKRHDEEMARVDARIRRSIRLAVQEARAERKKRREGDAELDTKLKELASTVDRFIKSIERGGNGHSSQN